jgi:cytochrome P450
MEKRIYPPGPKGLPYFGNLLSFIADPLSFLERTQRTYGDMATIRLNRKRRLVVCFHPRHVRFYLVEHAAGVTPVGLTPGLREILGDGLLTTDGEFHRQQRQRIQPAFHRRRMEGYASTMVEHTREMVAGWRPGAEVDIAREMAALTLRIVAHALFSVDLRVDPAGAELSQAFHDLIENNRPNYHPLKRFRIDHPATMHGKHMAARRALDRYIFGLIAQRKAEGRDTGDILSWLLETGPGDEPIPDQIIRDQTMTLFAAGHETTSNALTWTFYLLSQNPAARERLVAELQTVLAGRAPKAEDLPRLRYLDWTVTESMRLFPPAWTQGRVVTEPFELDGYHFPKGAAVIFPQWVIQRRPDIWGDPEVFRPERWDPAQGEKPPQWAYFPFGGGPRACIGMPFAQMEARLLLVTILQAYAPRLAPGQRIATKPRITLRPKYGMRMILEPTPQPAPAPAEREVAVAD